VAGAPGKRAQIAFLALAGLVVGADPASLPRTQPAQLLRQQRADLRVIGKGDRQVLICKS
jgi:hypothetical protein